jgi:hypothetical protein
MKIQSHNMIKASVTFIFKSTDYNFIINSKDQEQLIDLNILHNYMSKTIMHQVKYQVLDLELLLNLMLVKQ